MSSTSISESPRRAWWALCLYHTRLMARSGVLRAWVGLAGVVLLVLIVGLGASVFPNGLLWTFFGRDAAWLAQGGRYLVLLPVGLAVMLFFPIALSSHAGGLLDPVTTQYLLTRPVSRRQFVLSHQFSLAAGNTALVGGFLAALWLTTWWKGEGLTFLLWPGLLYVPLALSLHSLMLVLILAFRSANLGLACTLGYTFVVSGYLHRRMAARHWWETGLNKLLDGLSWLLPPVGGVNRLFLGGGAGAGDGAGLHLLGVALVSAALCTALSVWLYRRMDF